MEQLEKRYYAEEHITPYAESYEWYVQRPHSILALEEDHRIIGFMNLFPVKPEIYEQISNGTYNDKYLTYREIIPVEEGPVPSMSLFLSCIVIDDEYRRSPALTMLLGSYLEYYETFRRKGVRMEGIVGDAVTAAGERFLSKIGLKRHCASDHDSTIYRGTYPDFFAAVSAMKPDFPA
ncbi:hypothetical protein [Brevibacillus choshinensis]|uniref:N-acetyltransferase domain-containing protein n=1 Tax=Brevibacillus choshinensis TaxID=54911 RepID=A0ABX7FND9_BRECH|nr:hypothetical protein [Brevibacillus choshinensis]QRG67759.1 hypothetical protein JNE38_00510 [Brevibacillus choshinensis]